nr:PAS domain-containing protein [Actibacterium sp. MT2.3-13A]
MERQKPTAAAPELSLLTQEHAQADSSPNAIPDIVFEISEDGRLLFASMGGAGEWLCLGEEDWLGQRLENALPADIAALAREIMEAVRQNGQAVSKIFPRTIEDDPRWFRVTAVCREQGKDKRKPTFIFTFQDVTAEYWNKRLLERLRNTALRTGILLIITDRQRHITWCNEAFEARSGYTLEEARGKTPAQLLHDEQTDPETTARIRAALDAGAPVEAEIQNRAKDGRHYWVSTPSADAPQGRTLGLDSVARPRFRARQGRQTAKSVRHPSRRQQADEARGRSRARAGGAGRGGAPVLRHRGSQQ